MTNVRLPAVAGHFYSANKAELQHDVTSLLLPPLHPSQCTNTAIKALIVPHAGYIYSGKTAGLVYRYLAPIANTIKRVVLLGPAHTLSFYGIALSGADEWITPLGKIKVAKGVENLVSEFEFTAILPDAHRQEHSIEVQLPFLQTVLGAFEIIPLVVGAAAPSMVASLLERLWREDTLMIISSDLSHYLDYDAAVKKDALTCRAIEGLSIDDIPEQGACGAIVIAGLLLLAKQKGLHCKQVDYRNSGDTAGSKDAVVGYTSYVFYRGQDGIY